MNSALQPQGQFGIAAVILGVVALALAIIPRAIFEVPPPWPTQSAPKPQQVVEGGETFQWKGATVTIGGTTKEVPPPPPTPAPASSKALFIITTLVALAGIAVGVIASWRERSYLLAGPALALCSVALLWHYILIGVTVAIAVLIIVALLSHLSG
ncbi:hypothetical protein Pla175_50350 [Pirellulimonas nuda]|uniref:Uncharacterized protein n=2 Tax=Pirellulimonas nuda TaxID=2528009 RepID=A0A518DJF8_9BACT|nr:hypothetical protein Pla175_50350 [Pirellulimonas nuda]